MYAHSWYVCNGRGSSVCFFAGAATAVTVVTERIDDADALFKSEDRTEKKKSHQLASKL